MTVNVMLTVPGNTPQANIDTLTKEYDLRDVTVYDFAMYEGRCRTIACTLTVESLFAIGREQQDFVLNCEANEEMHLNAIRIAVERLWCMALLPEGPEVIQRVTSRAIELARAGCRGGPSATGRVQRVAGDGGHP